MKGRRRLVGIRDLQIGEGIIRAFTVGLLGAAAVATLILVGTRSRNRTRVRDAYRRALTPEQLRELGI